MMRKAKQREAAPGAPTRLKTSHAATVTSSFSSSSNTSSSTTSKKLSSISAAPRARPEAKKEEPGEVDALQLAAQLASWLHMTASLRAAFHDAQSSAQAYLDHRKSEVRALEAGMADQLTRYEAEQVVALCDELANAQMSQAVPEIVSTFLRHSDACASVAADAARLALASSPSTRDSQDSFMSLAPFDDLLSRIDTLRSETARLDASCSRLLSSSSSASTSAPSSRADGHHVNHDQPGDQGSKAHHHLSSMVLRALSAMLPVVRARGRTLQLAQELVLTAKENARTAAWVESLRLSASAKSK